jgi:hypothetical protein
VPCACGRGFLCVCVCGITDAKHRGAILQVAWYITEWGKADYVRNEIKNSDKEPGTDLASVETFLPHGPCFPHNLAFHPNHAFRTQIVGCRMLGQLGTSEVCAKRTGVMHHKNRRQTLSSIGEL